MHDCGSWVYAVFLDPSLKGTLDTSGLVTGKLKNDTVFGRHNLLIAKSRLQVQT